MRSTLSCLLMTASACLAIETTPQEWTAADGTVVRYQLAVPEKIEAGKTYPLVLFMHGAGERGTDNQAQLKHGVKAILRETEKINEPCFLIAPQCPKELWWTPLDESKTKLIAAGQPNPLLEGVMALAAELSKTKPVDPTRFYVTGISMGGFATWDLLGRLPEKIAAAAPICGGGDVTLVHRYKDVPIWAFHGEADPTVPVTATKTLVAALEAAGGKPKTTYYPGVGHDSWTVSYDNPELVRWLFDQRKKTP
jgi:predicted peptidase